MKIDYCSDLHLDNALSGGPHGWLGGIDISGWKAGGEILVVTGDTAEHVEDMVDFLNETAKQYRHVVAVLGNHENGSTKKSIRENVHVLDWCPNLVIDIEGVRFIGACLSPDDAVQAAAIASAFSDEADAVVGLSHYPPTRQIAAVLGRDVSGACASLLDDYEIRIGKPTTWICGHLHLEFDKVIHGVRIASNPRGYRARRRDGSSWSGFRCIEVGR